MLAEQPAADHAAFMQRRETASTPESSGSSPAVSRLFDKTMTLLWPIEHD
jgi:hypothetical protein